MRTPETRPSACAVNAIFESTEAEWNGLWSSPFRTTESDGRMAMGGGASKLR